MPLRWSQKTLEVTRDSEVLCICMPQAGDEQLTTFMASSLVLEKT